MTQRAPAPLCLGHDINEHCVRLFLRRVRIAPPWFPVFALPLDVLPLRVTEACGPPSSMWPPAYVSNHDCTSALLALSFSDASPSPSPSPWPHTNRFFRLFAVITAADPHPPERLLSCPSQS